MRWWGTRVVVLIAAVVLDGRKKGRKEGRKEGRRKRRKEGRKEDVKEGRKEGEGRHEDMETCQHEGRPE
jgi:hypothetical protein